MDSERLRVEVDPRLEIETELALETDRLTEVFVLLRRFEPVMTALVVLRREEGPAVMLLFAAEDEGR